MEATNDNDNSSFEALTFALSDEIFALNAHIVREILDVIPITDVPGARPFAHGLINVRGKVVPVADLRVKFGMSRGEATRDTRIVVIETELGGENTIVGLLADKVYEVTAILSSSIEEAPRVGMRWRADYIKGVAKRAGVFVFIPDIQVILASA